MRVCISKERVDNHVSIIGKYLSWKRFDQMGRLCKKEDKTNADFRE